MSARTRHLPVGRWALRGATALVLAFMLAPVVSVFFVSFFKDKIVSFPPSGYTLDWYWVAWEQDSFRLGLLTSILLGVVAALGSLAVGIPAGFVLGRGSFRGREAIKTFLLSPMMVPGIVAGSALFIFYIQVEIASDIQLVGSLGGLALAHIVLALPWTVRLVTASLVNADPAVEEAARTLGASRWTITRRITLPIIRPAIIGSAVFSFIASFVDLEKSLFLIGPGRTTLPIAMVNYLEWTLDPAIAAIATIQILIIITGLTLSARHIKLSRTF